MRFEVGPFEGLPTSHCTAVADGAAVVFRRGDEVRAYVNSCLHHDAPLDGGWIRDDVLVCPFHFWRYDTDDGRLVGSRQMLPVVPAEVVDGIVWLDLPDPVEPQSMREFLLEHARTWSRDGHHPSSDENHESDIRNDA